MELRRRTGWGPQALSAALGRPASTIWRVLVRHQCSRAERQPRPAVNRYEYAAVGELVHLDVKKLGRFWQVGKHVLGDGPGSAAAMAGRTPRRRRRSLSPRYGRAAHQRAWHRLRRLRETVVITAYADHGTPIRRILTDNGAGYRSDAFRDLLNSTASATSAPAPSPAPTAKPKPYPHPATRMGRRLHLPHKHTSRQSPPRLAALVQQPPTTRRHRRPPTHQPRPTRCEVLQLVPTVRAKRMWSRQAPAMKRYLGDTPIAVKPRRRSTVCEAVLSTRFAASSRWRPAGPKPHSQARPTARVAIPRPFMGSVSSSQARVLDRPARDPRDRHDAGRLASGLHEEAFEPVGGPLPLERLELTPLGCRRGEPLGPGRVERRGEFPFWRCRAPPACRRRGTCRGRMETVSTLMRRCWHPRCSRHTTCAESCRSTRPGPRGSPRRQPSGVSSRRSSGSGPPTGSNASSLRARGEPASVISVSRISRGPFQNAGLGYWIAGAHERARNRHPGGRPGLRVGLRPGRFSTGSRRRPSSTTRPRRPCFAGTASPRWASSPRYVPHRRRLADGILFARTVEA